MCSQAYAISASIAQRFNHQPSLQSSSLEVPTRPSISFVDKLHAYLVHLEHTTSISLLFKDEVSFQL